MRKRTSSPPKFMLEPTFSEMLFDRFLADVSNMCHDWTINRRARESASAVLFIAGCVAFGGAACAEMLFRAAQVAVRRRMRAKYFKRENIRRRSLRKPNRHIRQRTTRETVLPSPEVLLGQWSVSQKRGATLEKIRLGAMLAEIESRVDNSLIRNANHEIVGRRPGLRGWIWENCPELSRHYKTLMRYKSMADKLQIIGNLDDPDSVIVALPPEKTGMTKPAQAKRKTCKEAEPEPAPDPNLKARDQWLRRRPAPWTAEMRIFRAAETIATILKMSETSPSVRGAHAGTLRCLEDLLFETLGIEREVRTRRKQTA